MQLAFPDGLALLPHDEASQILPAGYAVVGAAAYAAGVTHTLSSAVIVCEVTGQLTHLGPILVRALIFLARNGS
jgi:chloride channel 2